FACVLLRDIGRRWAKMDMRDRATRAFTPRTLGFIAIGERHRFAGSAANSWRMRGDRQRVEQAVEVNGWRRRVLSRLRVGPDDPKLTLISRQLSVPPIFARTTYNDFAIPVKLHHGPMA